MPYMKVYHEVDPKQKLLDDIGDISQHEVFGTNILVAVYQRPTTTMLGGKKFDLTPKTVEEDKYQSKVGLVIAKGPSAFKDPDGLFFGDSEIKLHDWVIIPASAVKSLLVNGVMCRLMKDTLVDMRVADPDAIY